MSDGDSVAGALKDLGRETIKQIAQVPKGIVTGASGQILTKDTEEREAEKKAEKMATFQRIKEIEAEMAAIRSQNEQKKGPQTPQSAVEQQEIKSSGPKKTIDEASRQAVGRAEQGRNFKG